MSNAKSFRALIGAAAVLVATSTLALASSNDLLRSVTGSDKTLPGVSASADPCGPQKLTGPLGY